MRIFFALLTMLAGFALVFRGYRLARYVIPLWGFVAGLAVGGDVITAMSGTPFLGSVLGIIVGFGLGVLFGALAYLYYSLAVVVLIGAAGYWLGSSFIMLFGFHHGVLSVVVGSLLGIAAGLAALVLNAPKYTLIVFTSWAGAMSLVGGLLLLFNQMPLESFSYKAVSHAVSGSVGWVIAVVLVTLWGVAFQYLTTDRYSFEAWTWEGIDQGLPKPKHPSGAH